MMGSISRSSSIPYHIRAADGAMPGVTVIHKFGYNALLLSGVTGMIWTPGGNVSWLSAAETMSVVSSSGDDASGGTGARTVKLTGVDGNYIEVTETVTMAGLTPAVTTQTFLRVDRMQVMTAGSGEVNAGAITATASSAATTQCQIVAGNGQSQHAIYTVRAGQTLHIFEWCTSLLRAGGTNSVAADINLHTRTPEKVINLKDQIGIQNTGNGHFTRVYTFPTSFPEKTDIYFEGTASANASVSAAFSGIIHADA